MTSLKISSFLQTPPRLSSVGSNFPSSTLFGLLAISMFVSRLHVLSPMVCRKNVLQTLILSPVLFGEGKLNDLEYCLGFDLEVFFFLLFGLSSTTYAASH